MMKWIDNLLNNITMYRLVLYVMIAIVAVGAFFSFVGILPFNFLAYIFSVVLLLLTCWATNTLFAQVFNAPTNIESVYITALILAVIIAPPKSMHDVGFLWWAAVWSMASKYIFAIRNKHLMNPVALGVALAGFAAGQSATWWVGTFPMLPFVLLGGTLIVRKIRRGDFVLTFLGTTMVLTLAFGVFTGGNIFTILSRTLTDSPLFFFAFIMLTEPLTTPPTKILQMYYGVLTGVLYTPQVHFGTLYLAPETALLAGNVFSYLVSPKKKLILTLKEAVRIGTGMYDYVFTPNQKMSYTPGQYMEWTFAHESPDERGNRRYFTLSSSPTEKDIRIGVRFYEKSSSFKQALYSIKSDKVIVASQLAGDFVLPNDPTMKCVFIAGGIGITPFRSMLKYLVDTHQKRPIVLFYANRTASEIVYRDVFDAAQRELGIKTVYTLSDTAQLPANWQGKTGRINAAMITADVPDYSERTFYLSGPRSMVTSFEEVLQQMGIDRSRIKTDFFPGFA